MTDPTRPALTLERFIARLREAVAEADRNWSRWDGRDAHAANVPRLTIGDARALVADVQSLTDAQARLQAERDELKAFVKVSVSALQRKETRLRAAKDAAEAEIVRLREEFDRLFQAVDGYRGGSLTREGLMHYYEIARKIRAEFPSAD